MGNKALIIDKRFLTKSMMTVLSIVVALLIGSIVIYASGTDPLEAYGYLLRGALGDRRAVSETLVRAIPLIFSGLAFTFSLRCGIFNMGVEGQFLMGAMGSAACLVFMKEGASGGSAATVACLAGGAAVGCLWGFIPGFFKAFLGANEIIISWFLNYVAMHLANFLYSGPLMQTEGIEPKTALVPEEFQLANIAQGTRLHSGLIIVLAAAGLVYYFLFHTSLGMQCRAVGLKPVYYLLDEADGLQPSINDIESRITAKTKALMVNTPSNPTGVVFSEASVKGLMDIAKKYDLYVLSDEIYDYLTYDGYKHSSLKKFDDDGRVILISGASKKYAMTGWRVGVAIANPEIIEYMGQIMIANAGNCCSIAQKAYEAGILGPQNFVSESRRNYLRRRDAIVKICDEAKVPVFVPQGAFYLWIDISKSGMPSDQLAIELLSQCKVAVAPGSTFGASGINRIRVSFG
ncbi:MAG: aminotransferase class I/II-fold pyridoxal phosphate-dependent enzyme, partial [Clostridiales bacterium]|nr:aminotransferase class I/II-fold pyridoxal phosphate-dependent enzyme [Clostridiales bacterium]